MKLNNEVMLIGVACLIVGGAAGYLLSEQNQSDYMTKGYDVGVALTCYTENNQDETATLACIDSSKQQHASLIEEMQNPEYLEKNEKPGGGLCPPLPPVICGHSGGIKFRD